MLRRFVQMLCVGLPLACAGVQAAPAAVEAFDAPAWKRLQGAATKPTVVVFTATYCTYCPDIIEQMAREIRQRRADTSLVAVVTDTAPGEADRALLAGKHYSDADRLLAFSGSPALRYAPNPQRLGGLSHWNAGASGVPRHRWMKVSRPDTLGMAMSRRLFSVKWISAARSSLDSARLTVSRVMPR